MRSKALLAICLALFAVPSMAQPRQWGLWFSGEADSADILYAVTMNDGGQLFGQYCFPAQNACVYLLGTSVACDAGRQYPVLVSTDIGSAELELLCGGPLASGRYRYVFTDFDTIDALVRHASKIGFVLPLMSDRLSLVLFELVGSNEAIAAMRATAAAGVQERAPTTQGKLDPRL